MDILVSAACLNQRLGRVSWGVAHFGFAAGLLSIGLMGSGDAWSQARRKPVAPPPPSEVVAPPAPQEQTVCSRAYHAALTALHDRLKPELASTRAAVRQPTSDAPLRWIIAQAKPILDWNATTTARLHLKDGKSVCPTIVVAGGVVGCALADGAGLPSVAALPVKLIDEELRVQRLLEVYLRARGAAPEFGQDGKFHWTLSRVRQDIENLTGQPPNAALCTGVPEAVQFVSTQFQPIAKRIEDIAAVTRLAGEIALRRVVAANAAGASREPMDLKGPVDPSRLAELAANAVLTPEAAMAMNLAPTLAAKLMVAEAALRKDASSKPGLEFGLAISVFRSIEVFGFATDLHLRYAQLGKAYVGGLDAIVAEHKAQCTCAD